MAKERAKEIQCRSNLRSLGLGMSLYSSDHDQRLADVSKTNGFFWVDEKGAPRKQNDEDAYWGVAYRRYIKETSVFGCASYRRVAELIYPDDPFLIHEAAYCINANVSALKVTTIKHPVEFIVSHDHVEPKIEHGSRDMFHNDGPNTENLTDYRQGGWRADFYRGIFRHAIRYGESFRTGGRANLLWLDSHVSILNETMGDDVPQRWYTGGLR
jgi:prepilin-type processing-associated H-X9-DG protein